MLEYQLSDAELLLIEQTNLVATEKFMLRITLSVWKILIYIGDNYQTSVENLSNHQIIDWMVKDSQTRQQCGDEYAYLKWNQNSQSQPDLDFPDPKEDEVTLTPLASHEKFLTRLLISAIPLLKRIAQELALPIKEIPAVALISTLENDREYLQWQS
jgi:hypothetical protein